MKLLVRIASSPNEGRAYLVDVWACQQSSSVASMENADPFVVFAIVFFGRMFLEPSRLSSLASRIVLTTPPRGEDRVAPSPRPPGRPLAPLAFALISSPGAFLGGNPGFPRGKSPIPRSPADLPRRKRRTRAGSPSSPEGSRRSRADRASPTEGSRRSRADRASPPREAADPARGASLPPGSEANPARKRHLRRRKSTIPHSKGDRPISGANHRPSRHHRPVPPLAETKRDDRGSPEIRPILSPPRLSRAVRSRTSARGRRSRQQLASSHRA